MEAAKLEKEKKKAEEERKAEEEAQRKKEAMAKMAEMNKRNIIKFSYKSQFCLFMSKTSIAFYFYFVFFFDDFRIFLNFVKYGNVL